MEKFERTRRAENSRTIESQRMRALDSGRVQSERWAEVDVVSPDKEFNLGSMRTGQSKSFNTGSAYVKDFNYVQKTTAGSYGTRGFWGSKQSAFSEQRYATGAARTSGNYLIPNATKKAATKTAAVKDARESNKTLAVRDVPDGNRQFLGRESERINHVVDPNKPVGWEGGLKEMSIEDLRELLNKNK